MPPHCILQKKSATSTDHTIHTCSLPDILWCPMLSQRNFPKQMVPRTSETTPPITPPLPQGAKAFTRLTWRVAAKGSRSQGKNRSLLRDLNLLVGGWNLNPLWSKYAQVKTGTHLPPNFGVFFCHHPVFSSPLKTNEWQWNCQCNISI